MLSERVLSRKNIVGKISPRIATKPVFECQNIKKIIVCKPIQYELKYVIIMQSFIVLSFFFRCPSSISSTYPDWKGWLAHWWHFQIPILFVSVCPLGPPDGRLGSPDGCEGGGEHSQNNFPRQIFCPLFASLLTRKLIVPMCHKWNCHCLPNQKFPVLL